MTHFPRHACPYCGDETRRETTCHWCTVYADLKVTEAHGLPAGEWVRRGNVRVFVAAAPWDRSADDQRKDYPTKPRPPCGTTAGYRSHLVHIEDTCRACRDAMIRHRNGEPVGMHTRQLSTTAGTIKSTKALRPHGTHAAFSRHKNRGEDPCDMCIWGEAQYQRHRPGRRRAMKTEQKEAA